jgi:GTP-binding protein Era
MNKKAAFVAVLGRPSAGKSTLVNSFCGEKVSIVSPVPQTTRNAIRGIVNREQGQLVFIDTPGRHKSGKKFNQRLSEISGRALEESDLILYLLDTSRAPGPEEEEIAALVSPHAGRAIAALNKTDAAGADTAGAGAGRARLFIEHSLPGLPKDRCLEISALRYTGTEALLEALFALAPEGEPLYSDEFYTDQEVDFRIAEIIREQAINRLREELPHALYVEVADAEFADAEFADGATQGRPILWVRAFVVVERDSQKGMVVGKGGAMIKAIRLAALKELRRIFDWKIELDLRVKSKKDWRSNDITLRKVFPVSKSPTAVICQSIP